MCDLKCKMLENSNLIAGKLSLNIQVYRVALHSLIRNFVKDLSDLKSNNFPLIHSIGIYKFRLKRINY